MILKIYKNKSTFISNHYFLKNTDNDNKGIFDTSLKRAKVRIYRIINLIRL